MALNGMNNVSSEQHRHDLMQSVQDTSQLIHTAAAANNYWSQKVVVLLQSTLLLLLKLLNSCPISCSPDYYRLCDWLQQFGLSTIVRQEIFTVYIYMILVRWVRERL